MKNLFDNFEMKYLPLYIVMVILIGCMLYFSQKHIREAVKEVKAKKRKRINSIKKPNSKEKETI
jgi:uncharacterized membrane protein